MSKRYKKQSIDSSLFHHGLIKIMLMHHLSTVGNYWDGILTRNGFATTIPAENPNSGEPLIKKQFDIPSNEPNSLNKNPLDKAMPSQSSHEKKAIESEVSEPHMPKFYVGQNITVKLDVKKYCKQVVLFQENLGIETMLI
jgi:hypothetical protein